ncbi:hypothetical protein OGAPHI_004213 [Ogataea philodendri]|uniref:WAC domain-containing protein n=1 Tax=Ogataea philodendri TaxID=1378263 RepID=A0A9P8P6U6_9ASCO|nr:uncharacterized protein OGAPHI_004213 [Ogataea philodendri]KAH3666024.1 hypothetical protein OGAPHI_004213 [Ogataea philodendri]
MVLFKRKKVEFAPPPTIPDDFDLSTEVWYIPETREWFLDYDQYLSRMDYYNIKKFVCETSGNSNFTYFEALKVEQNEMGMMESRFPEPVKEPILRYVSFSTTHRIDGLVDEVYAKFKDDFFPGDQVVVKTESGDKAHGIVREKARFNAITLPDGTVKEGYCSYRVLLQSNEEVTINSLSQISRERNSFTKWYVKAFLKMSLTRSTRQGSPWVLKDSVAKKYRISLEYPEHLKQFEQPKESLRKLTLINKLKSNEHIFDNLKETPPTAHEQENGFSLQIWKQKWYDALKHCTVYFQDTPESDADPEIKQKILILFQYSGVKVLPTFDPKTVNFLVTSVPFSTKATYAPDNIFHYVLSNKIKVWHYEKCFRFFKSLNITYRKIMTAQAQTGDFSESPDILSPKPHNGFVDILPQPSNKSQIATPSDSRSSTPMNVFNGNKFRPPGLIDDLKLPFRSVSKSKPKIVKLPGVRDSSDILETWIFLNMYAKALVIDNFTFDDYFAALKWNDEETLCPLLMEIYCGMFKAFMDGRRRLLITLPKETVAEGDDDEKLNDEDDPVDADVEMKEERIKSPPSGDEQDGEQQEEEEEEEEINHNAYSFLKYKNRAWEDRLATRQFKEGNWLIVLIGIMSLVQYLPEYKTDIVRIFETLAPAEEASTAETIQHNFYQKLTAEDRAKTIAIVMSLLLNGTVIRNYMDKCLEDATSLRRDRLELIKEFKVLMEEGIAIQKNIIETLKPITTADIKTWNLEPEKTQELIEQKKKVSRLGFSYLPPEPTALEKAVCASNPEFMKLVKQRVEKVKEIDEMKQKRRNLEKSLNEIDSQRVCYIGRDRFYNRYWWFEKNGLPNLSSSGNRDEEDEEDADMSDGDSEYEEDTYLMGRLWIQGPGNEDRKVFLKFDDEQLEKWSSLMWPSKQETGEVEEESKPDVEEEPETKTEPEIKTEPEANVKPYSDEFMSAVKSYCGFTFENGEVKDSKGFVVVDQYGSTIERQFSAVERKILEEGEDVLLCCADWGYLELPEQIEELLKWLNIEGEREKQLRKKIVDIQDQVVSSLSSRAKTLGIGRKSEDELKFEKIIADADLSEDEDEDLEQNGDEESRKRKAEDDEIPMPKRTRRGGNQDLTRQMQREREAKLEKVSHAREMLHAMRTDRDRQNLLAWVNSRAVGEYGYSHYEGPKVAAKSIGRGRKKGRR